MGNIYAIYFSATGTTLRCVDALCQGLGAAPHVSINLADDLDAQFPVFDCDDMVVVAAPVYGGRLPELVAASFARLRGNNAIAIAMAVYGNRDYDDALLELTDLLGNNGFRVIGAGAFIGQHSIFPKVGTGRPGKQDEQDLMQFGNACIRAINAKTFSKLRIKGKRPYKKIAGVPIHPKGSSSKCVKCGKCVTSCPIGAIDADAPWLTDGSLCLTCGRCISVCTQGARRNSGLTYILIGAIFKAAFSKRKAPFWTTAD